MSTRHLFAVAAVALLLLLAAALPAHAGSIDYTQPDFKNCGVLTSGIQRCGSSPIRNCYGCLICNTGYFLVQTYSASSDAYVGLCVNTTDITEGCASVTEIQMPLINEQLFTVTATCAACKNGYTRTSRTVYVPSYTGDTVSVSWAQVMENIVMKQVEYATCSNKNAASGPSSAVPLLLLLGALVTALYTVV